MRARKDELRRELRRRREALSAADVAAASGRAAAHALALLAAEAARPRVVALFAAMPAHREIDPRPLHDALAEKGVTLVYPRVPPGQDRVLRFHVVADPRALSAAAGSPALAVPSPTADLPEVPLTTIDVFFVPGLAFDLEGDRLGWGRGYYDHTLAAAPRALRVGFAFELQVIPVVPVGPGDERVDHLVTEAGAHRTTAAAGRVRRVHCP